jgi:hypothetical protein
MINKNIYSVLMNLNFLFEQNNKQNLIVDKKENFNPHNLIRTTADLQNRVSIIINWKLL